MACFVSLPGVGLVIQWFGLRDTTWTAQCTRKLTFHKYDILKSVGPLLPFEDFTNILVSPGQVTGPSQDESSCGAATLILLDLHAFL